jgi:hypothetical protein
METALAISEKKELRALESTIEKGIRTFYEVGAALLKIRDSRLYRETNRTFEDYCRDRWDMSARKAQRLMVASDLINNLRPIGVTLPATESQVRPLTKLESEQRVKVWEVAVETAPNGKVTAKHVKVIVDRMTEKKTTGRNSSHTGTEQKQLKEKENIYTDAKKCASLAILHLDRIQNNDPNRRVALIWVKNWIERELKPTRMAEVMGRWDQA